MNRPGTWLFAVLLVGSGAAAAGEAAAGPAPSWHDSFTTRLEALALLETLNADLLSHDSATKTLEHWCAAHHLASPATVVAERVAGAVKSLTPAERELLQLSPADAVRYRRVRLHCGALVLSQADNWYVPDRLTPDMNHELETTDRAFGKVIAALHFRRETLASVMLWRPLPEDWEIGARPPAYGDRLPFPQDVLQHRALLRTPDGKPLSLVVETYTSQNFAFPEPATGR